MSLKVLPVVLQQHAEEAAFLWVLRDRTICAPHYFVEDLAKLDSRVEAHLDGLRVAGEAAWEVCREEMSRNEPGEVFASAVLAFESRDEERIARVLKVGGESPQLSRALTSALGWTAYAQAEAQIKKLLASPSSVHRRIGIAAAGVHRRDPGKPLVDALQHADPLLRARALRAAGELGRTDLRSVLELNLNAEDEECRFWAAWSCVLLRDQYSIPVLRSFAGSKESRRKEQALMLAMRRMELEGAHAWEQELSEQPDSLRLAIIGAAVIGDPRLLPGLIEQMAVPVLARVAGEAFTMITGADLAREHLDGEKPDGFESGPTEDPKDENVEMDPDDGLPWPALGLIQDWWTKHQSEFVNGSRYLLGKPITHDWLRQVLRTGRQRQRAAAALELAILQPGQPLFNVAAPGLRQQRMLGITR